jgi:hypothetical protein
MRLWAWKYPQGTNSYQSERGKANMIGYVDAELGAVHSSDDETVALSQKH